MASLADIISTKDGCDSIEDENDTFRLERASAWSLDSVADALPKIEDAKANGKTVDEDRIIDYDAITKYVVVHDQGLPQSKETPYFNHQAYFANLKHYQSTSSKGEDDIGRHLLYGEVVTSTNTLLEKYEFSLRCHEFLDLTGIGTLNCFGVFQLVSLPRPLFRLPDVGVVPMSGFLLPDL